MKENPDSPAGLGAPAGVGCPGSACASLPSVQEFIAAGSPRLALAKARGVRFAPFLIPITAKFPDASTASVAQTGSTVTCIQDTYVDAVDVQVQNGNTGVNSFSTMSDYFFNAQSGILATLDVLGAPRYSLAPKFVPLTAIRSLVSNSEMKWILTAQQQPAMAFSAEVPLPAANLPTTVYVTFRAWVPIVDTYTEMTRSQAVDYLASEFGIDCGDSYAGSCK